ncbi:MULTISPECIES: hypothetical protein [unclassified Variovorax]|nr:MULTISPECIES: hypothetical protein [unclassified Variovorax]
MRNLIWAKYRNPVRRSAYSGTFRMTTKAARRDLAMMRTSPQPTASMRQQ